MRNLKQLGMFTIAIALLFSLTHATDATPQVINTGEDVQVQIETTDAAPELTAEEKMKIDAKIEEIKAEATSTVEETKTVVTEEAETEEAETEVTNTIEEVKTAVKNVYDDVIDNINDDEAEVEKEIRIGNSYVEAVVEVKQKRTNNREQFKVQLNNGRDAEIKIMPEAASTIAIEKLQSRICTEEEACKTIQLKEVGQNDEAKIAYEIETKKEVKILGLFKAQMTIKSQVDAENGEVISEKKPRWGFLARFFDDTEEETIE